MFGDSDNIIGESNNNATSGSKKYEVVVESVT